MNFPEKLKKLRKDKGITQEELANAIFVSRTLVSKYENGSVYPTKENVQKLALYFNVPISSLIDKEDTIELILKQNDLAKKINYSFSLIIIVVFSLFAFLSFIPFLKIRYYDYSNGSPPILSKNVVSPIQLTVNNNNPIAVITLITLIMNIIVSVFCIICINRGKDVWLKIVNYILFVVNLFLLFFTIVFIIIYFSNNTYDLV
jgi:transcriptional regulator with XRE-family HTH domain